MNQKADYDQRLLQAMNEDDRIVYHRSGRELHRSITIYRGMLTEDEKQQLEGVEKVLFDLSDDVEEETKKQVKKRKQ